jgi:hypothetical protein
MKLRTVQEVREPNTEDSLESVALLETQVVYKKLRKARLGDRSKCDLE